MKNNKIICQDCGIEKDQYSYYLSRIVNQERMNICKDCFEDEVKNNGVTITFRKYDIPFINELWNSL